MGKLNEIQEQTTQSYGDNSFTTSIKVDTVEFDSLKDSFTFNDPIEVPSIKINGTEIATFDAEDKAKLDSLTSPMQVKGRVDGISDLPDDASVGDVYLVGLSGDGNFEEYVCVELSGSPEAPVWENLGHVKVQSDWNQSNNSSDNYIKNKPAIKAGQGENSIIEGDINTNVAGVFSHAEGSDTKATNLNSHAEGNGSTASGANSHAEGAGTTALSPCSHAEGRGTTASGFYSHAEGDATTASGTNSHTEGLQTIANHESQHVFGEYNIADPSLNSNSARGTYIEIVGNGTDENTRSNVRTLDWSGNEYIQGIEEASLFIGHTPSNESINGNLVWSMANLQRLKIVTLNSATNTITLPNGGNKSFSMQVKVIQDATGSRNLYFVMDDGSGGTTNIKNPSGVDFIVGSANQSCIATLLYDGNGSWWIEATSFVD